MPAITFAVRWPDDSKDLYYSPSTVLREYFKAGDSMSVRDFLARADVALRAASGRVEAKFGYACSSAMDQLTTITAKAERFATTDDRQVLILGLS